MRFEPGRYYVGDPCYAVPDELWDEWCDVTREESDAGGHSAMLNDWPVWAAYTVYGDGRYEDQYGNEYAVDSGSIGVVPIGLIVPEPGTPAIGGEHLITEVDGGHVVQIDYPFEAERDGNIIVIGPYKIDTDPPEEDTEEVWGEDHEEEW